MVSKLGQPPKVTRERWIAAALSAMSISGLPGITVEGLARQLGISKGSFYGYFSSRDDLIVQALQLWKDQHEELLIQPLRQIVDPRVRFRALTDSSIHVAHNIDLAAVTRMAQLELKMMAFRDDPAVAEVLEHVNASRIDLLRDTLVEIGIEPAVARKRAIAGHALSLGVHTLLLGSPAVASEIDNAYIDELTMMFLSA